MAEHAGRDWVFSLFDIVILGRDARAAVLRGRRDVWLRPDVLASITLDQSASAVSCRCEETRAGTSASAGVLAEGIHAGGQQSRNKTGS
jgi:hypothetical protein